jgi:tetratricopeptide (TPR) repeat protein/predicted Ser/Thr protein kinase
MGDVYLGIDERLQRKVALKAIRADRRLDAVARARFEREARILSQLDHPHICRVYDYVAGADADVIVLEFIEGQPLTSLLRDQLPPLHRQRIAEQVAEALAAAHGRGVVHRDLKPGNVMVRPSGDIKVVDFGLAVTPAPGTATDAASGPQPPGRASAAVPGARPAGSLDPAVSAPATMTAAPWAKPLPLTPVSAGGLDEGPAVLRTQLGQVLGTPLYMSPEQARGEPVTAASDMFAFGLLLQELFTGRPPHPLELGTADILARAAAGETLAPGPAPRPLVALIERLKSAEPAARPTALDALERLQWIRARPRRRAVRLAIAAALAALALAGVKYTLDVRRARDEANRHRAQAEDLIGFMLGDLRDKLEPLGKLDLLDTTGDKALAYFASLAPDEMTDADRLRHARALMQVGQVRIAQGQAGAAQQLFAQALRTTRSLDARAPGTPEVLKALGAARFWVGYVHWNEGRLDAALAEFREYLGVAQQLVAREPGSAEWQMELAQARGNIGAVLQAKGDLEAAIPEFREAVAAQQRLVDRDASRPEWLRELANSQSWLGDALQRTGDVPGATEQYHANVANLLRLRQADPENRLWQYLQCISHTKVGLVMRLSHELEAAQAEYEASRDLARSLTAHDPANLDWRRELGSTLAGLGRVHLARGDVPTARAALEESVSVLGQVAGADVGNADFRQQLASARALLSRVYELEGRLSDALQLADEAAESVAPLGERADPPTQRRVAEAALARARALARLGRGAEAARAIDRAVASSDAIGLATRDPDLLMLRAEILLRAGRAAEAAPLLVELDRQRFASPELDEARGRRARR